LPQQDVLGHPNIRLFITHGGLLSTQEAVYHGVPIIGIPFFADQDVNMESAQNMGFGLKLEIIDITADQIHTAIQTVLSQKSYRVQVARRSKLFRDQQTHPRERALWWMEYLIRHKGAPHLHIPAAKELNIFQYFLLDVLAVVLLVLLTLIWVLMKTVKCMLRVCCPQRERNTSATQLNKKKN